MSTLRARALAFIPLFFLVTLFWKPALFDGKTIVHGDSITDGLSMLALQARSFHHLGQLLWADGVYGGHPLFAEGQGAFASPLNMFLAWIVSPLAGAVFAMNFGHWLMMLLAGVGVIGLCRSLGASRMAAALAAIAVTFSPIWIGSAQNLTIQGALTWAPWAFWALEEWLKRPEVRQAILLGMAVAMIILSGYPQAFHGAVLYMALTLLAEPFDRRGRGAWIAGWRRRAATGALAVAVCAGLSAVQWLPLLELTGLSRRSAGIGIYFQLPFSGYLRGLLFTWPRLIGSGDYFPGAGSLLVIGLAALALVVPTTGRMKGHMLAALILVQLGWGEASPLFRLLYDHNVVPGLRYFRTVHLYIDIAVIGFAIMAAVTVDRLRTLRLDPSVFRNIGRSDIVRLAAGVAIVVVGIVVTVLASVPDLRWMNFGAALGAIGGGLALVLMGRSALLPALMLALLVGECLNLRTHSFHFYDPALLAEPASAAAIAAVPGLRDDKLFDGSTAGVYGFTDSRSPALPSQTRRMMEANCSMTDTMWNIRSMNGALALPMRRQVAAEDRIRDEVTGKAANSAGARLLDVLAVRFISLDQPLDTAGFAPFWSDPALGINVMENKAARPRFQLYAHHLTVGTPEEALAAIEAMTAPTLVIENPPDSAQPEPAAEAAPDSDPPGRFDILKAKSTDYRVDITADRPAWFFVADANYPGWRATLDGKRAPLFSAQLLGKAVAVPPGRHRLEIAFVSSTFIAGLSISAVSVFAALLALWAARAHSPGRRVLHSL